VCGGGGGVSVLFGGGFRLVVVWEVVADVIALLWRALCVCMCMCVCVFVCVCVCMCVCVCACV
jgi:hypothetical protein